MSQTLGVYSASLSERITPITGAFAAGSCTHLLGANGAGKSSLLEILAGISTPDSGRCSIGNEDLARLSLTQLAGFRSYLGQHSYAAFAIPVSDYLRFYAAPAQPTVPDLLEQTLEVRHLLSRPITALSGGERQRVELTRSLLQVWPAICDGQGIILLDEPLQGLDVKHQFGFLALSRKLSGWGNTVVLSCHDIGLSANHADCVWLLKQGQLVCQGAPREVLTEANLYATFDCHFAVTEQRNFLQIHVCDPIVLP
ncbi:ATP-binding cassette domain-containing protein [Alteromonas sp. ASW11-19]|uniref:ATP-binding cassette domain-containing protein n=1 Tax=Alteromonas salexigens TaxID=2982530 RepID=A0ABT2VPM3_9ALTE|nr:ATP-binding cassette domain-containing protein [Alteromonas salexigens]MCU7555259.1 ATP-binding cassette domain-containing protein [Alteromonas salexigens]